MSPPRLCHPTPFLPVRPRFSTILCKFAHKKKISFGCHPPGGCHPGRSAPTPVTPLNVGSNNKLQVRHRHHHLFVCEEHKYITDVHEELFQQVRQSCNTALTAALKRITRNKRTTHNTSTQNSCEVAKITEIDTLNCATAVSEEKSTVSLGKQFERLTTRSVERGPGGTSHIGV